MFRHDLSGIAKPFAEIYVVDNAVGDTVGTTKEQILQFGVDGESFNAIPDHSNDHITIKRPGRYLVNVTSATKSADAQSIVMSMSPWKNNGATELANMHVHRSFSGGSTDHAALSMAGIHNFSMDDTLEVWMAVHADTRDLVVVDISLAVAWLGV